MAVQKLTLAQGVQNASVLAFSDQQLPHLHVEILDLGALFANDIQLVTLESDLMAGLPREHESAGDLMNAKLHPFQSCTFVVLFFMGRNGEPALLIFFECQDNRADHTDILLFVQNVFD
jgi:hypothetical protein